MGRDKLARRHFTRPVKIQVVLPYKPRFSQSEFSDVNYVLDKLWSLFFALVSFLTKKQKCSFTQNRRSLLIVCD